MEPHVHAQIKSEWKAHISRQVAFGNKLGNQPSAVVEESLWFLRKMTREQLVDFVLGLKP
jgi:hypothetical protein